MPPYYFIIPDLVAIICAVAGMLRWRHIPASLRLLTFEALLSVIMDISGYFIEKNGGNTANNHALINILMVFDFFLLLSASYSILPLKTKRLLYPLSAIIFTTVWSSFCLQHGIKTFAYTALVTLCYVISVNYLAVLLYVQQKHSYNFRLPVIFIALGLLLYHCCVSPLFMKFLYLANFAYSKVLYINPTLDTIKYLMITAGFLLFKKVYSTENSLPREAISR
ncbi:hypothetical protein ACTHGU_11405 [Chitinophagaceae bacterium MMS25-I14]